MIEAELLLCSTGLLQAPDKTSRIAARTMLREMRDGLLAVLERDEQTPLRVNEMTVGYHKRLLAVPPYETTFEAMAEADGQAMAGAYQMAHTMARDTLLTTYPSQSVEGIFGTQVCPPDPERLAQWLLEVDTIENQRIIKDFAAAALLPETVLVFSTAFPLLYGDLRNVLNERLKELKLSGWDPPPWLDCALRTFMQLPVEAVPPAPPPVQPEPAKVKLAAEEMETKTEQTM